MRRGMLEMLVDIGKIIDFNTPAVESSYFMKSGRLPVNSGEVATIFIHRKQL